ncbi:MAG: ABC-ATPase domain-containing protein [Desulfonauticus sp.]|nr:ABC-ATPase domain-containing protein [Desulfonauticus sp.]
MKTASQLTQLLIELDGKGYKAYKKLVGTYQYNNFTLFIDHVQSDPFAPPSKIRLRVAQALAKFPQNLYSPKIRNIALADYLTRLFHKKISLLSPTKTTGKSGLIYIDKCGQEVLERSSCKINSEYIELRFYVGLPARGRTILGRVAQKIFFSFIPQLGQETLFYKNLDIAPLQTHIECIEDQDWLRQQLPSNNLVAFIANGSILPRESGISEKPLEASKAIKFQSPPDLEVEFILPNKGKIKGMGIKKGITLIVGGGFHGKSTLLKALEKGIYNHIPGDGREFVVSLESAVKIRAEDGRSIVKTNISPFISNLPLGQNTHNFTTQNASGSTSQAANIIEALESGTKLLLLDEDTCATNFMLRDKRMQELVQKQNEPITPFLDRIEELYKNFNVSTILVLGGCGDYLDVANLVLMLNNYKVINVTNEAKSLIQKLPLNRKKECLEKFDTIQLRYPDKSCFNELKQQKIKAKDKHLILAGKEKIEIQYLEQIACKEQTNTLAKIFSYLSLHLTDKEPLSKQIDKIMRAIDEKGLDFFSSGGKHPGSLAFIRKQDIMAALNRYRKLKIQNLT